jgi:hypothetical protein
MSAEGLIDMMTELVTGLLKEIAVFAVKGLSHRLLELKAIKKALDSPGEIKLPTPVIHALDSIEVVAGSWAGILTEPLHDFLSRLKVSPLPAMMAQAALMNQDSPGLRMEFESLFLAIFKRPEFSANGKTFTANDLYQAINSMLAASIQKQSTRASDLFIHLAEEI